MPGLVWTLAILWGLLLLAAWWWFRFAGVQAEARSLLLAEDRPDNENTDPASLRWLRRWLYLAGYRHPSAPAVFLGTTALLVALGGGLSWILVRQGAVILFAQLLTRIPGGVGEVFLPLAWSSPWLVAILFGALPWMLVRQRRQRRVQHVEQDLPLTLDLLATLAEAGLGFDSAVARVLQAQPAERPLTRELRQFQAELMSGRARIEALRRLGARLDVMWFTIFISAVIQAERLGTGLAEVLRIQADDLRSRRRERALGFAMALPSKLVFPLVACFFPAIAVVVLGPAFFQILQLIDGLFRGVTG